jgi:LysM repeat protein
VATATVLVIGFMNARAERAVPEPAVARIYVVKPGDTVWSIVRRHAQERDDPRPLVDRLIELNRLRDAVIRPGQELVLPS